MDAGRVYQVRARRGVAVYGQVALHGLPELTVCAIVCVGRVPFPPPTGVVPHQYPRVLSTEEKIRACAQCCAEYVAARRGERQQHNDVYFALDKLCYRRRPVVDASVLRVG